MRDYLTLGGAPYDEQCVQVTDKADYKPAMRLECARYKTQLEKQFADRPDTVWFVIKTFPHDFGSYSEVCISFDPDNVESTDYAQHVEWYMPATWRDTDNV